MRRQIIDVLDNNSNIVLYVLIENFNEGISHEDKRKIVENIEDFKISNEYIKLIKDYDIRTIQIEEFDALTEDFGSVVYNMIDDILYYIYWKEASWWVIKNY